MLKIGRESKTEAAKESGTKSNIERANGIAFCGDYLLKINFKYVLLNPKMGCLKLKYYSNDKPLDTFRKNLKVVKENQPLNKKSGLNYSTFGATMPGRSFNSGSYRYGVQGQEMDNEVKGNGNHVDFKFRGYDPRTGRFWSTDPLASQYPFYTPYAFSGNRVIDAFELEGLEPESVVNYNAKTGEYKFTKPAIHLLSLVSGVNSELIANTQIVQKTIMGETPWYNPNEGGGAITSQKKITYTQNFFTHENKDFDGYYKGDNSAYSIQSWLGLSSHEVGHLPQAEAYSSKTGYFADFAWDYFKSFDNQLEGTFPIGTKIMDRTHDGVAKEYEADKGRKMFDNFNLFIDNNYGKNSLENLFNSDKSDDDKINQINTWFNEFQEVEK